MPGPKHTAEQIVRKLRTAGVELAKGRTIAEVCKIIDVADQTNNRWRKESEALKINQSRPDASGDDGDGGGADIRGPA